MEVNYFATYSSLNGTGIDEQMYQPNDPIVAVDLPYLQLLVSLKASNGMAATTSFPDLKVVRSNPSRVVMSRFGLTLIHWRARVIIHLPVDKLCC